MDIGLVSRARRAVSLSRTLLRPGRISRAFLLLILPLSIAAVYTSILILQQQATLRRVDRYNATWIVTQTTIETARLTAAVGALSVPGSGVGEDDVRLRLDLLASQIHLLTSGEAGAFVRDDQQLQEFAADLSKTMVQLDQLSGDLGRPDVAGKMLAKLLPLNAKATRIASAAYVSGTRLVGQDLTELSRRHWLFAGTLLGLIVYGAVLVVLLYYRNSMLGRAHQNVRLLVGKLRQNQRQLLQANEQAQQASVETQQQNARFDAALNNMSQALCMADEDGRLIVCNFRFMTLFQLSPGLVQRGTPIAEVFTMAARRSEYDEALIESIWERQKQSLSQWQAATFFDEDSNGRALAVSHQPMANGGWVATYEDISQRRQIESRIAFMAHHDSLTGLPNRLKFQEHLRQAVANEAASNEPRAAVFCLDLDRFKDVNDTLGHPTGDQLLQVVGERLMRCVRKTEMVARLGGDEFAVLQVATPQPRAAQMLAQRIVEALSEPYDIKGQRIVVTASVGIAIASPDDDPNTLIKHADIALYRAKSDGRNGYRVFRPEMAIEEEARRVLDLEIREVLGRDQLRIFYQPLVDTQRNRITGFEALLRWRHPELGMIEPSRFIPLAEDLGLIGALGEWVLKQACADAATWPDQMKVAVNLSPIQFKVSNVMASVRTALETSGLAPSRLELEITESAILRPDTDILNEVEKIRKLGVRFVMDDFGTGYSSLSYLHTLRFDKVKFDKSFARSLSTSSETLLIIQSMVEMIIKLGMQTTIEGVETAEQAALLRTTRSSELQGYYFSQPMALADIRRRLNAPGGWQLPEAAASDAEDATDSKVYRLAFRP